MDKLITDVTELERLYRKTLQASRTKELRKDYIDKLVDYKESLIALTIRDPENTKLLALEKQIEKFIDFLNIQRFHEKENLRPIDTSNFSNQNQDKSNSLSEASTSNIDSKEISESNQKIELKDGENSIKLQEPINQPIAAPQLNQLEMEPFDLVNKRIIANIPIFSGNPSEFIRNELKVFLEACEYVLNSLNGDAPNVQHFYRGLKGRFRGPAYEVVTKSNPADLEALSTLLKNLYAPPKTMSEINQAMYSCKQRQSESTREYIVRLNGHLGDAKAYLRGKFPQNNGALIENLEKEAINVFKRGASSVGMKQHLLLNAAATLHDLATDAMNYEDVERQVSNGYVCQDREMKINTISNPQSCNNIINNRTPYYDSNYNRIPYNHFNGSQNLYNNFNGNRIPSNNYKKPDNFFRDNRNSYNNSNNVRNPYDNAQLSQNQNDNQPNLYANRNQNRYNQYNNNNFDKRNIFGNKKSANNSNNGQNWTYYQNTRNQGFHYGEFHLLCRNCGFRGHEERFCPRNFKKHYDCQALEHYDTCPHKFNEAIGNTKTEAIFCDNCGARGHKMSECQMQATPEGRQEPAGNGMVQIKDLRGSAH